MKKHIVCFGDSNTHGYCAETNGRFDEMKRWTGLLQKKLGEEYLICEEGLNGRTSSFQDPLSEGLAGLDYILPCLLSHEPVDLLILMLGTNDTKERFSVSPECIVQGLLPGSRKSSKCRMLERRKKQYPDCNTSEYRPGIREDSLRSHYGPGLCGKIRTAGTTVSGTG